MSIACVYEIEVFLAGLKIREDVRVFLGLLMMSIFFTKWIGDGMRTGSALSNSGLYISNAVWYDPCR